MHKELSMKKPKIMKTVKLVGRVALLFFTVLQICLVSSLIGNRWTHISSFVFILLWYVVLVKVYKENVILHRHVDGKRRNILITFQIIIFFSDNLTKI